MFYFKAAAVTMTQLDLIIFFTFSNILLLLCVRIIQFIGTFLLYYSQMCNKWHIDKSPTQVNITLIIMAIQPNT
jgi:hypothetical protein